MSTGHLLKITKHGAACLNPSKISGNVMIEGIYQFQPNLFFRKPPVPKLQVDLPDWVDTSRALAPWMSSLHVAKKFSL